MGDFEEGFEQGEKDVKGETKSDNLIEDMEKGVKDFISDEMNNLGGESKEYKEGYNAGRDHGRS